jgi:aspartate aminotransferase
MVLLSDGLPVMPFAGAAQGYKITPRQLATSITPKTRLVLLNSPCNPTGAAYTRAELRALGEVLLDNPRVVIGTDDMYEKIFWDPEPFCSLLTAVPELYNRTVTINGVSKGYAMTGWRIGYCGGPREIIAAMSTIQGQSTSNASSISQKAATAALNGDQGCVARMNDAFKARHDFIVQGLNSLPGVSCLPGAGTFYAFADVSKAMASLGCREDGEFAELLLSQGGVAVVPGSGFGAPGHVRLSFACSMQTLEQALERMRRVITGNVPAGAAPLAATG